MKTTLRAAALTAFLAASCPSFAAIGETAVLGYPIAQNTIVLSSGESILGMSSVQLEGFSTVSGGQASVLLQVYASTPMGALDLQVTANGQEGAQLPAKVTVNGSKFEGMIRVARVDGCQELTCPASARLTVVDGDGMALDLYVAAARGAH